MTLTEDDTELALRSHVRSLLLEYALTHLTTDYLTFTEDVVAELLSDLASVPTTDPTHPLLETEPLDALNKLYGRDALKPYEERSIVSPEALLYLKRSLQLPGKKSPAARCWDADVAYDNLLCHRPMSPILTTRAIQETPKIGVRSLNDIVPSDTLRLIKVHGLTTLDVEKHYDLQSLKSAQDEISKMPIDAEIHTAVVSLLSSVTQIKKPASAAGIKEFLRVDSPPLNIVPLDSPPLFPRDRRPGHEADISSPAQSGHSSGLSRISDLPSMVSKVEIQEDEDDDLYKQHMVVVHGWQAYEIPSSPITAGTPSLGGSSSDIDELFLPSPPGRNQEFIESLISAQMDEHEIPRTEKVGGSHAKSSGLGDGEGLASFLSPLLRRCEPPHDDARIVTTPKSRPSSPHTHITMSMLGQAPSVLDSDSEIDVDTNTGCDLDTLDSDDPAWNLGTILEQVCGESVGDQDPHTVILKERLDEKESLLMDVPEMPPPTAHTPAAMSLPAKLSGLLVQARPPFLKEAGAVDVVSTMFHTGFLKRVKGLQSLNIELTWRPFKFGATIPTDEEMAGVADDIQGVLIEDMGVSDAFEPELSRLLNEVTFVDPADNVDNAPSMCPWWTYDASDDHSKNQAADVGTYELVMTRSDRRQLYGMPDDEDLDLSDKENIPDVSDRSPKRRRTEYALDSQCGEGERYRFENVEQDDSGIFMVASPPDGNDEPLFGQLAYSAEGFEGRMTDGDLFLDIDPIHQLEFVPASPYPQSHYPSSFADSFTEYDRDMSFGAADTGHDFAASTWCADKADDPDTFIPLSFEPTQRQFVSGTPGPSVDPSVFCTEQAALATDISDQPSVREHLGALSHTSQAVKIIPPAASGLADRPMAHFLQLRAKTVTTMEPCAVTSVPGSQSRHESPEIEVPIFAVPKELIDLNTLVARNFSCSPNTHHRYMASMDVLQKRALVRCLSSQQCAVDLVERHTLGDVDLILDPDTAVLFVALATLPSQLEMLSAQLCEISWRYLNLLVVFEVYPSSMSYKHDHGSSGSIPLAFSAPIIKAVKKLRRDLGIAEAYQTKRAETAIHLAFATTVEEAAMFTRTYGDLARARDVTGGAIWGARSWFDLEDQEGECDIATFDGMNAFAASIILSLTTLDEFLDKGSEERLHEYGGLVGSDRITQFNQEFARRAEAMRFTQASPE